MTPSRAILTTQLHSLRHTTLFPLLEAAAAHSGLDLGFVLGICSRETNCLNILGDYRGGQYHGVGLMQIDIQHPEARKARDSGSWKTQPAPLIQWGVNLLAQNLKTVAERLPRTPLMGQLKIAASGYNCGLGTAISASLHGDSDTPTTGQDYGRDVIQRMLLFEELLHAGH
jgi:hypothetical protein